MKNKKKVSKLALEYIKTKSIEELECILEEWKEIGHSHEGTQQGEEYFVACNIVRGYLKLRYHGENIIWKN